MNVPNGWRVAPIADVTIKPVKSDPATTGRETIRYVDIGLLGGPVSRLDAAPEIPSIDAPSRCRQVIMGGDTLYSTVRPYLRKVAFVGDRLDHQFASTGYSVLRPTRDIHPKFLYLFTLSQAFEDSLFPLQKGVSYPAVLDKEVRSRPIWFPPLPEQRRIVETVEEQMAHLDAADASLASVERRVIAWREGALEHLIWHTGADTVSVGDVLREPMRNGRSDRAVSGGEGTRALTLTAVTKRSFTEQYTKITSTPAKVVRDLWLEPGDILVQRSNTPDLVGTCARYQGPREWAIFPDLLIRLRPDESRMRSDFLELALRSRRAHKTLRSKAKGLAGSMPKIDQAAVASTLVPCPPPENQLTLASKAHDILEQSEASLIAIEKSRLRSAALRRAVLATAFSGRLTRNHRSEG